MSPGALSTGTAIPPSPAPTRGWDPEILRELARRPLEHGLARLLRQCLPPAEPLPQLELVRTKYKPGRALTAYYRTGQSAPGRWLAVAWRFETGAPGDSGSRAQAVSSVEAEAGHRQLLAPFTGLAASDSTSALSVLVSPADPTMTQLVRLQDPAYVTDLLHSLAGPAGRVTRISTVRYRPGQRHVLRADNGDGPGARTAFLKIDRDESGAQAIRFARVMGPQLAAGCPGATLCTPWGYGASDRASVWAGSPGHLLSHLLTADPRAALPLVALLGRALRFLHDSDDAASVPRQPSTQVPPAAGGYARAEAAATVRACEHIAALVPGAGASLRVVSDRVLDQLDQLPEEGPRLTHGDAKCDNVVSDGQTICLLDLDRVGWGDPAMDLGKLLADLRWWSDQTGRDATPLTTALVAGYRPCDPARWARARLLAVLFQLKLTARRTPLHEAGWTGRVRRGLESAARLSTAEGV